MPSVATMSVSRGSRVGSLPATGRAFHHNSPSMKYTQIWRCAPLTVPMTRSLPRGQEKRARWAQTWTKFISDGSQDDAGLDKVFHKNIKLQLRGLVRGHVSVVYVMHCNKYNFIVT